MASREGSITVFLTVAGMLIFALLGTLVETARFGVCANHAARTLRTSAEALLTEYKKPLYEHYGLFFIEQEGTPYETVIARYAGDTMEAATKGKMDLLKGVFKEIRIKEKVCAGDDGAKALGEEITAYMKRKLVKKQWEKFKQKTGRMYETEKQAQQIEHTVDEQRELASLNISVLELMKLVDGISVNGGQIRAAPCFIKMFSLMEKPEAKDFGVTHAGVFKKMKTRLDTTLANWDAAKADSFLKKTEQVLAITKQAVREAENLRGAWNRAGCEKDGTIENLINGIPVLRGNLKVLEESAALLRAGVTDETPDRLKSLWRDYDTCSIVFDYSGIEEGGGAENPLRGLERFSENGILQMVCENPDKLSKKKVTNPDGHASLYKLSDFGEKTYDNRIQKLAGDEEVELSGALDGKASYAWDKFCQNFYIPDRFCNFHEQAQTKSGQWKRRLLYQWEYILAGGKTDRSNLQSVLNRILLIRTVLNLTAIYRDSGKKGEAYAAAAAIVGFTGMEPLIRLTQTLILVAWSMVESLVDIAGLLLKRDVPMIKNPSQILTSFAELFQLSRQAIIKRAHRLPKAGSKSVSYSDYLKVFLFSMKSEKKRYRIMDVIQWDMRENGYGGFQMGQMVSALTVQASASFPARLFCFAPLGRLLGRDLRQYQSTCEIKVSYF